MASKPKFDPTKKFEVVESSKPKFDPNKPYEEIGEPKPQTTAGEAAFEHAGDALALGLLPQLQAKLEPITDRAFQTLAGLQPFIGDLGLKGAETVQAAPWSQLTENSPEYVASRDRNIARLEQQSKEHPIASTAGSLGGGLVSALALPIPGLGAVKGAGLLKTAAKGALGGAVQGALMNPGDVKGQVNPLQLEQRIAGAEKGALIGGAIPLAAAGIGKTASAVKNIGKNLSEASDQLAFKSSGAMLKDFRQYAAKGEVEKIGKFMKDEGLVKLGDTFDDVAQKANAFNEKAAKELDTIYSEANEAFLKNAPNMESMTADQIKKIKNSGFNPIRDKEKMLSLAKESLGDSVDGRSALNKLEGYLDDLSTKYGDNVLDPRTTNNIKSAIDDTIRYSRNPLTKQPDIEKAFKQLRTHINKANLDHIETLGEIIGKKDLAQKLIKANKDYGYSKAVIDMAKDRTQRETANQTFGLGEKIAGGAGAVVGGILGGGVGSAVGAAGSAAANKLVRKYGTAAGASGAGLLSKVAEKTTTPVGLLVEKAAQKNMTPISRALINAKERK